MMINMNAIKKKAKYYSRRLDLQEAYIEGAVMSYSLALKDARKIKEKVK